MVVVVVAVVLCIMLVALENCRFGVSIVVAAADIENMAIRRHQWPDRNEKRAKKEQTKQQTLIHMKTFVTNPAMTSVEWIHFGLLSLVSESELRHFLFAAHCYELIEQRRRLIYANITIIIICWSLLSCKWSRRSECVANANCRLPCNCCVVPLDRWRGLCVFPVKTISMNLQAAARHQSLLTWTHALCVGDSEW